MIAAAVVAIQSRLAAAADPAVRDWWERYLKHAIPFRGVRMAGIRAAVHDWHGHEDTLTPAQRRELALALVRCEPAEDKLAGVLLIQEILLPDGEVGWRRDLPAYARLFDQGHIYEWNTCDWFCVRVLGPLAARDGASCARAIGDWRRAPGLWRRRAAGVAFVNLAPQGDANFDGFVDLVLSVCETTVRDPERFAQTGTGWVLRELSRAAPDRVARFVEEHAAELSREAQRMATAKLSPPERERLLARSKRR